MQAGFQEFCVSMAYRLAAVTPGARSDPFFIDRKVSHFMNGVDHPDNYRKHVVEVEKKRREEAEEKAKLERMAALSGSMVLRAEELGDGGTTGVEVVGRMVGVIIERKRSRRKRGPLVQVAA